MKITIFIHQKANTIKILQKDINYLNPLTDIRVLQLYYTLNIMVAKQCTLAAKCTPMMATCLPLAVN